MFLCCQDQRTPGFYTFRLCARVSPLCHLWSVQPQATPFCYPLCRSCRVDTRSPSLTKRIATVGPTAPNQNNPQGGPGASNYSCHSPFVSFSRVHSARGCSSHCLGSGIFFFGYVCRAIGISFSHSIPESASLHHGAPAKNIYIRPALPSWRRNFYLSSSELVGLHIYSLTIWNIQRTTPKAYP